MTIPDHDGYEELRRQVLTLYDSSAMSYEEVGLSADPPDPEKDSYSGGHVRQVLQGHRKGHPCLLACFEVLREDIEARLDELEAAREYTIEQGD